MTKVDLQQRWTSPEGRRLARDANSYLVGDLERLPEEVGFFDGRRDLRGLTLHTATPGRNRAVADGEEAFRSARWTELDLSSARLIGARFFDSEIVDCRFDESTCFDWRLWNTAVTDTTFIGTGLRDAALGTWHDERSNAWSHVSFVRADLRDVLFRGCDLDRIDFRDSRLRGAQFEQVRLQKCVFRGDLREVTFDSRDIPNRPESQPFSDVDFSHVTFADTEFLGCRFIDAIFPSSVQLIPEYPLKARQALRALESDARPESQMLKALLTDELRLPGREDTVGVFNYGDFAVAGGEPLAELARQVLVGSR